MGREWGGELSVAASVDTLEFEDIQLRASCGLADGTNTKRQ